MEAEIVFMLQHARELQELPKVGRGKEGFSCRALEGVWPFLYLDVGLLASRTLTEYISVILNLPKFVAICLRQL